MAYSGLTAKLSIVEAGANAEAPIIHDIGYIGNFSVEETRDVVEITRMGSADKEKMAAGYSWSASADGTADFETATSQTLLREAMVAGTPVQVRFYLDATEDKLCFLEGKALVESMSIDLSAEDKGNVSIGLSGIKTLEFKQS